MRLQTQVTNQAMDRYQTQRGQVGIITLLIMSVVLTIAISLSQKTLQEQEIAMTQEDSTRAFNAAETGVEDALYTISEDTATYVDNYFHEDLGVIEEGVSGDYSITKSDTFEMNVIKGETIEIPLIADDSGDEVDISWWYQRTEGCLDTPAPSALVVSVYNDGGGSGYTSRHFAYDPCATNKNNNFVEVLTGTGATNYTYGHTIDLEDNDVLLRVLVLHSNTQLQVVNGTGSPIETALFEVNSRGVDNAKDLARALNVKQSVPAAPKFMDSSIFSGSDLTK